MNSTDKFLKPSGIITMILHDGGEYNIKTGMIENGNELARKEIKNLIVNDASKFMAMRMAPGKTNGKMIGSNYQKGECDGEFDTIGLQYLAVGVGILVKPGEDYDEKENNVNTSEWDLQNPPMEQLTDSQLRGELFRKKFTDWKFIDSTGNISENATNILLLSTTFLEGEAVGPLTEMGLYGGSSAQDDKNTGIMFNYKTFKVWNKPQDSRLTIVWRLTF